MNKSDDYDSNCSGCQAADAFINNLTWYLKKLLTEEQREELILYLRNMPNPFADHEPVN